MTAASMVGSAATLTRVYVPPAVFAVSAAAGGAVNFVFGLVPLFIFQLALGPGVAWTAIAIPFVLIFLLAMIAGIGLFVSTLAIRFDDVLNLINVLLFLVGYLTPTFYPISIIPVQFQRLFYLNPMFSYVIVFRYLDYGGSAPSWLAFVVVGLTGVVGLLGGLAIFARRWRHLAAYL